MPISLLETFGEVNHELQITGRYITNRDLVPVLSKTGRAKILQSYERVPYDLRFIMTSDANDKSPLRQQTIRALEERQHKEAPDSIQVVFGHNFTSPSNYMPFTAWILAHRMGHINLMYGNREGQPLPNNYVFATIRDALMAHCRIDEPPAKLDMLQGKYVKFYDHNPTDLSVSLGELAEDKIQISCLGEDIWRLFGSFMLNTRCARQGKDVPPIEVFAEFLAQYLITGKIAFVDAQVLRARITAFVGRERGCFRITRFDRLFKEILEQNTDDALQQMLTQIELTMPTALDKFLNNMIGKTWAF